MRIRGRSSKMRDLSSMLASPPPENPDASSTRFMLPSSSPEFMLTPPSAAPAPASYITPAGDSNIPTAVSEVVCMTNCQWSSHRDALDPELEQLNSAPIDSCWRKPRAAPGLAYTTEASALEVQKEVKIGKKVMKMQATPKKMKKSNMKGKVIQNDVLRDDRFWLQEKTADGKWRCKRNDGRKWQCDKPTGEPNVLCEHHLRRKSSSFEPKEAASTKGLATSKSSSKTSAARAAFNSQVASSSVITLPRSKQPRKKKMNDDLSGQFYYYDVFSRPSCGNRRRGSSSNIVEAANNVVKKNSQQEHSTAEAREEDDAATKAQGQGYNPPDEALDSDSIDETTEDDEDSDEDYCAPLVGSSKPRAKNVKQKVSMPDLNCSKTGTKRFKSLKLL